MACVWTRKSRRGSCMVSLMSAACGSEDIGRSSRWRGLRFHALGRVMLGWSLVLVREQRRERNSLRVVDNRRHCRYLMAPRSVGGGRWEAEEGPPAGELQQCHDAGWGTFRSI